MTRPRLFSIICGCLAWLAGSAFSATTALDAVKLLPKEKRRLLALIEARDGAFAPERWHLLVCDPTSESGLREYVVADGAIVAERTLSQFAENLVPEQALGDAVRFDSDRAAFFAQQYAQINAITPASIAYELRRDGAGTAPTWRVTCFDETGKEIAELTVSATKGTVISHRGFAAEPPEKSEEKPRQKFQTSTSSQVAREPVVTQPPKREAPAPPQKKTGLFQRLFGGRKP